MKIVIALGLAALMAGCGADGPPIPPKPKPQTGVNVTIGGTAEVGISGGW